MQDRPFIPSPAANLNASYVRLEQAESEVEISSLILKEQKKSKRTAFALVRGRSHSGEDMGIIRSIRNDGKPHPTVAAVLKCLVVQTGTDYEKLCDQFDRLNVTAMKNELLERDKHLIRPDEYYIHDPHSMVIFRVMDDHGYIVADFDLILTGKNHNPERLP